MQTEIKGHKVETVITDDNKIQVFVDGGAIQHKPVHNDKEAIEAAKQNIKRK